MYPASTNMADRRKAGCTEERIQETDRQFLERTGVSNLMRDVLAKVVANRPIDPIDFLAEYFMSEEEQISHVEKACQVIQMTHHSRPVFESNVRVAYDILGKPKTTTGKGSKKVGLTGAVYTDLLYMLCSDIPTSVTSKLMTKIQCCDFEAIPYDVFRSAVFTCCVLQDYARLSAHLFDSLDVQKCGKANKILCDAVLDQLKTALGSSRNDVKRIMESGYNLGPDGLHLALDRALSKERSSIMQTLDNFIIEACESFLAKVKKLS